jgi:hypothetical protein
MTTHKIGIKFFFSGPATKPLAEYIPVFHGWIQQQALPGHLLIDVHDYSHVHHGPGILLVAHEANLSVDEAEGRRGLLYLRKQPASPPEILAAARQAANLLGEPYDATRFEVFVNDRLAPVAAADLATALDASLTPKPGDPRARPTFLATVSH